MTAAAGTTSPPSVPLGSTSAALRRRSGSSSSSSRPAPRRFRGPGRVETRGRFFDRALNEPHLPVLLGPHTLTLLQGGIGDSTVGNHMMRVLSFVAATA